MEWPNARRSAAQSIVALYVVRATLPLLPALAFQGLFKAGSGVALIIVNALSSVV